MSRSMTAYSRAISTHWKVELHSVNRKILDIQMFLSRDFLFLEMDLRKVLSEHLTRGQITVKITFVTGREKFTNISLLKKLKSEWEKTAKALNLPKEEITLSFLFEQMAQVPTLELSTKIQTELKATLQKAVDELIQMKKKEGKNLTVDILKRVKQLKEYLNVIEKRSVSSPEKYRKNLLKRLEEILENIKEDERILREIALFAEKIDISEEIVRLNSHFQQVTTLLNTPQKAKGRTLEFYVQEILREFNTIASKSPDLEVIKKTISSKTEIEKIKEQLQNIE